MKTSFLDSAMPLTSALAKLCAADSSIPANDYRNDSQCLGATVVSFVPLKFKYVITIAQGNQTAILFPAFVEHKQAISLPVRAISAGFAWLDADRKVHVKGESTSLKLKSRPEDADIIRETLFMTGL
jgi:hypothetical protein